MSDVCPVPDCTALAADEYLCQQHYDQCKQAMMVALPALLEAMTDARAEAERWLAADWEPAVRWVYADGSYRVQAVPEAARSLTEGARLGFVDDPQPRYPSPDDQIVWQVSESDGIADVWHEHLAKHLAPALEEALRTFPLANAGAEIKLALVQNTTDEECVIEELERVDGLSDDARRYLFLKYLKDQSWLHDPDYAGRMWLSFNVLPAEINAILEALPPEGDS